MAQNEKVSKALYYASLRDATEVIAEVPIIGDIIAHAVDDIALNQIRATLSPEELKKYLATSATSSELPLNEIPSMMRTLNVPPPSLTSVEKGLRQKGWALPPSPLEPLKKKGWKIP